MGTERPIGSLLLLVVAEPWCLDVDGLDRIEPAGRLEDIGRRVRRIVERIVELVRAVERLDHRPPHRVRSSEDGDHRRVEILDAGRGVITCAGLLLVEQLQFVLAERLRPRVLDVTRLALDESIESGCGLAVVEVLDLAQLVLQRVGQLVDERGLGGEVRLPGVRDDDLLAVRVVEGGDRFGLERVHLVEEAPGATVEAKGAERGFIPFELLALLVGELFIDTDTLIELVLAEKDDADRMFEGGTLLFFDHRHEVRHPGIPCGRTGRTVVTGQQDDRTGRHQRSGEGGPGHQEGSAAATSRDECLRCDDLRWSRRRPWSFDGTGLNTRLDLVPAHCSLALHDVSTDSLSAIRPCSVTPNHRAA